MLDFMKKNMYNNHAAFCCIHKFYLSGLNLVFYVCFERTPITLCSCQLRDRVFSSMSVDKYNNRTFVLFCQYNSRTFVRFFYLYSLNNIVRCKPTCRIFFKSFCFSEKSLNCLTKSSHIEATVSAS